MQGVEYVSNRIHIFLLFMHLVIEFNAEIVRQELVQEYGLKKRINKRMDKPLRGICVIEDIGDRV